MVPQPQKLFQNAEELSINSLYHSGFNLLNYELVQMVVEILFTVKIPNKQANTNFPVSQKLDPVCDK